MTAPTSLEELADQVGQELGTSSWHGIDQTLVDTFAAVTGDQQWIHVDPDRAAAGPYGGTIAHGQLVLSLVPGLVVEVLRFAEDRLALNKEVRRARFHQPVPVGRRVRGRVRLTSARSRPRDFWELELSVTVEVEQGPSAALTTELVLLYR